MELLKRLGRGLLGVGLIVYASATPAPDCQEAVKVGVYENSINEYGHLITSRVGVKLECQGRG